MPSMKLCRFEVASGFGVRAGLIVNDEVVGQTRINQIKRRFSELSEYLFRSQRFPNGAVLLTGAGIVPEDTFTLEANDSVRITISGIGTLENPVAVV